MMPPDTDQEDAGPLESLAMHVRTGKVGSVGVAPKTRAQIRWPTGGDEVEGTLISTVQGTCLKNIDPGLGHGEEHDLGFYILLGWI